MRAARALKATWSEAQALPGQRRARAVDARRRRSIAIRRSSVAATPLRRSAGAAKKLSATYFWPFQSHASLGPSCAVADVRGDGSATIWSASQGTHGLRANLSKVFGLSPDKVRVVFLDGSGSYGTNGGDHVAADAVLLSKTLGQPGARAVDASGRDRLGSEGPAAAARRRGRRSTRAAASSRGTRRCGCPTQAPGARALLAADAAGLPQDHGQGAGAITQNGDPPYRGRQRPRARALAEGHAAAAVEPARAGKDRERVRGRKLHRRARGGRWRRSGRVPARPADRSARHRRRSSGPRRRSAGSRGRRRIRRRRQGSLLVGRGVAYMRYKQAENYVAMAMEVAVDPATRPHRRPARRLRARLRAHRQPRRAEEPDRGLHRADAQPRRCTRK